MQEPEAQPGPNPSEEIERLQERLLRLEAEHAEVQQTLFDHYEWTRQKTKAFGKELRSLRAISLEYQVLEFLRGVYQRTTGLPVRTINEDVELLKISLVAVPAKNDPHRDEWLRALLKQTHTNFDLYIIVNASDPEVSADITDRNNVRVVRVDDSYSDAVRANIGLCWTSKDSDIHGLVMGGYWPYERSLENVARFFAAHHACQIMTPINFAVLDGLSAPTDKPGWSDFLALWRNYGIPHGSFFFRPDAFKKLGRIVYEVGDSWLFATLLQFAWDFTIGHPDSLIFVNGFPSDAKQRHQRQVANREVRDGFYWRNTVGDWRKPVRTFLVRTPSDNAQLGRIGRFLFRVRWTFQRVRHGFLSLLSRLISRPLPLFFGISGSLVDSNPGKIDLSGADLCPITERLPDRLLFSLQLSIPPGVADVFYSSETSLAVISQRKSTLNENRGGLNSTQNGTTVSREDSWRFLRPLELEKPIGADQSYSAKTGDEISIALDRFVDETLKGEEVSDAIWIGDGRFDSPATSQVRYTVKRRWEDYPDLVSADFGALRQTDVLTGRTTDTGFDLIHLAGILQFSRRPRHLLRFLAFAIKYHRFILVSTPNLDSSDLQRLGPAWCHWEPARTRFIYGVKSLRLLMRHCGFEEKKLVSFTHPSWTAASRRNLANAIPGGVQEFRSSGVQESSPSGAPDLKGDFLIGLFSRKL